MLRSRDESKLLRIPHLWIPVAWCIFCSISAKIVDKVRSLGKILRVPMLPTFAVFVSFLRGKYE